jgi:MscS family membrane protein
LNIEQFMARFNQLLQSQSGIVIWIFLVVLAIATAALVLRWVLHRLEAQAEKSHNMWDDAVVRAIRAPALVLLWVLGISWIGEVLRAASEATVFEFIAPVRDILVIGTLTWFVVRFIKYAEEAWISQHPRDQAMDQETIHTLGRLLRTAIIVTAVLVTMQTLGYNISGVLALGSIGGIALSFASKDMLANFFGGVMVYLDRPFSIGDWIRSPDRAIEGTVEHIGWRSTRIRAFDQRPLYVPNAAFTTITVENPSRMRNRRIYETIGVRYGDFAQLGEIVAEVREMLLQHDEIDTGRTLIVNFNAYGPSSLEFFVYTFTRTTDWVRYHAIKQDVLLTIGTIISSHGAEIAFPTTTVHLTPHEEPPIAVTAAAN